MLLSPLLLSAAVTLPLSSAGWLLLLWLVDDGDGDETCSFSAVSGADVADGAVGEGATIAAEVLVALLLFLFLFLFLLLLLLVL